MLNPQLERELREEFAHAGRSIDVPDGLAERLVAHRGPRRPRRRLLVSAGGLALLLVVALLVGLLVVGNGPILSSGNALQRHLKLRLVDDEVALVSNASLATAATISAVSCSSANDCIAVGAATTRSPSGFAATTADGGTSWDEQPLPTDVTSLAALSCSSAQKCVAVGSDTSGGALLGTSDGGQSWSLLALPGGVTSLTSVSCGADRCWAVGSGNSGAMLVSGRADASWASVSIPNDVTSLSAVGCTAGAGSPTCMAVGSGDSGPVVLVSISGAPWAASAAPPGARDLASAACTNSSAPVCTTLVQEGNYWVEASRFVGVAGQAGDWRVPQLLGGGTVATGTVLGGVSTCISVGGPSCTPSNADLVDTVTSVIADIGGQPSTPGSLNDSLTSGYIASQPSFSQPAPSSSPQPLSPVWYLGISPNGLSANEVLAPAQRLS